MQKKIEIQTFEVRKKSLKPVISIWTYSDILIFILFLEFYYAQWMLTRGKAQ